MHHIYPRTEQEWGLYHIRKTPHLLFHLFQCFSMLFSEKAEKAKKSNPLYFFCTCQTAKKKHKKSRLPNGQKWTKEMSKKVPNIQCSPRKKSKKAQKAQEKYRGLLVTSSQYFSKRVLFLLRKAGKSMKSMEK